MSSVTVSNKGQVVIPADIRKQLGIAPGSLVDVAAVNGKIEIELRHKLDSSSHDSGFGMLKYAGPKRNLADFDVAATMRQQRAKASR
jgi:antitoxin PrlF